MRRFKTDEVELIRAIVREEVEVAMRNAAVDALKKSKKSANDKKGADK